MSANRFLLAIIPPQEVIDYIDIYRRQYAKNTNYIIPPHITICPPFYLNINQVDFLSQLNQIFQNTPSFQITLNSVDFFTGKNNVAFFKPEPATDIRNLLVKIQTHLSGQIQNVWPDYPTDPEKFTPHLTIAEHIPDPVFESVKEDLENILIHQEFTVSSG